MAIYQNKNMSDQNPIKNVDDFIAKIHAMNKDNTLDLSSGEDLSIAIMNLVSLEEHFFFSANKTGNDNYYDLLNETREMRKLLMKDLVKNPDGEEWCISKHLLAASMRLSEVGTKYLGKGKKDEAKEMFNKAYNLYSLFWGINLKAVDVGEIKKIDDQALSVHDTEKKGFMGKLGELVKKAVDCCIE